MNSLPGEEANIKEVSRRGAAAEEKEGVMKPISCGRVITWSQLIGWARIILITSQSNKSSSQLVSTNYWEPVSSRSLLYA